MIANDEQKNNLVEFQVPRDQHIQDVFGLEVDNELVSFGFKTNENMTLFPFDMSGYLSEAKTYCKVQKLSNIPRMNQEITSEKILKKPFPSHYLNGIQGSTMGSGENQCLIDIRFSFVLNVVPDLVNDVQSYRKKCDEFYDIRTYSDYYH